MNGPGNVSPPRRLLVGIASYGRNHLDYLSKVIRGYQSMAMDVDIVVFSEAPKDLGPGVEVMVGLPSKDPWSLAFAHKRVFAERAEQYDLFAYSEDDIGVREANIEAFIRATHELAEDEIAGFLLYEKDQSDRSYLPNFHGHFHWKPDSVRRRGVYTVAEFSNEHAAFYLLTQAQLKRAIASGGYLREPYVGRHDMLCAAATDPYTCCGFRKVICLSAIEDFLLHHLPNRYVGKVGIPREVFNSQVQTLFRILQGTHPASSLCEVETKLPQLAWSKSYYEEARAEIVELVPECARTVLSVGCGWGALEGMLEERGARVTALPLDSVIGATASRLGIEVVYGTLEESLASLVGRSFDCVLVSNLLHLQRKPAGLLARCSQLVGKGGTLVVSGRNFNRVPNLVWRLLGVNGHRKLRHFEQSGVSLCGPGTVARQLGNTDLHVTAVRWFNHALPGKRLAGIQTNLGSLTAKEWVLQARRDHIVTSN